MQGVSSRPDAAVAAIAQDSWNPAIGWAPPVPKPPASAVDVKSRAVDLPDASDAEAPAAPKTAEGQWISSVRAADDALRARVRVGVTPRVVSSPLKENDIAVGPPMKAGVTGGGLTDVAPPANARVASVSSGATVRSLSSPPWCASPDGKYGISIEGLAQPTPVTNNRDGVFQILVQNRGTLAIPSGSTIRYTVFTDSGDQVAGTTPTATIASTISPGAQLSVTAPVSSLAPANWRLTWDVSVSGVGSFAAQGACAPTTTITVMNQAPSIKLLSPSVGGTVSGTTPFLSADGTDPDVWPGGALRYIFTICTNAALTIGCITSPLGDFTWQIPAPGLNWGGRYYWKAIASDGNAATDSTSQFAPNDFSVVVPGPDDWRQVGNGLGLTSVDGVVLPYGIFTSTAHDAAASGANTGLSIDRIYSSGAAGLEGAFGLGWLSIFDSRAVLPSGGSLATITYPDGRQESFGRNTDGSWATRADLGVSDRLKVAANGDLTITETAGESVVFDSIGQLKQVIYPGASWDITRSGSLISKITQKPSGRSLSIGWANPGISCPSGPDGIRQHVATITVDGASPRTWSYGYNCARLITVQDPTGGTTHYATTNSTFAGITAEGRALQSLVSLGSWNYAFSTPHGERQITVTEPGSTVGKTITLLASAPGHQSEFVDSYNPYGGRVARYCEIRSVSGTTELCPQSQAALFFDPLNRLVVKQKSPAGAVQTPTNSRYWLYDQTNGELIYFADENSHGTQYTYDADGNPSGSFTFRDSNTQVTSTTFLNAGRTATDPQARVSGTSISPSQSANSRPDMFQYDANGRLVQRTSAATPATPAGETTNYLYSGSTTPAFDSTGATVPSQQAPAGLLTSATKAGGTSSYRYAPNGDMTGFSEVGSGGTLRSYDNAGFISSETTSGTGGSPATITFSRDAMGRVTGETHQCVTNAVTGVTTQEITSRRYDHDGLQVEVIDSALDCVSHASIAANRKTTLEYDVAGRLTRTVGPVGDISTYTYDAANPTLLASTTDPRGKRSFYDYSALNGKITAVHSDVLNFNAVQNLLTHTYQYDPAGRLTAESDADGRVTNYEYTGDDLVSRVTRPNTFSNGTTHTVEMWRGSYDGAGRVTSETIGGSRTTSHTYDSEGRLQSSTVDPTGLRRTTTFTRDTAGRTIGQTVSNGTTTSSIRYAVDAAGQLTRATTENGATDLTTAITRDANELITSVVDPRAVDTAAQLGETTTINYDALGHAIEVVGPSTNFDHPSDMTAYTGLTRTAGRAHLLYGYNAFGELTETKDALGQIITTAYDAGGRPVETDAPDYTPPGKTSPLNTGTLRTYSAGGDKLTETDPRGATTTFTYGIGGELIRVDGQTVGGAHATTLYFYTHEGELYGETSARGGSVRYERDALGRIVYTDKQPLEDSCCTDGGVNVVSYWDYDDVGNLIDTYSDGNNAKNGAITRYGYDAAGEIVDMWLPGQSGANHLTYDVTGRVTKETDAAGRSVEHAYDLAGREITTTRVGNDGTRLVTAKSYDAAGHLTTQQDPTGSVRTWAYDEVGRLDSVTQQTSSTLSQTVSVGYDAAGQQVRTRDPRGFDTWTAYNAWGLKEKVIEPATTAQPALSNRSWTYEYELGGGLARLTQPGGATIDRTYDALGQVTTLAAQDPSDPTANVTHHLTYSNAGDITSIDTPGGTQHYTWGSMGQMLSATGPLGNTTYSYDDRLHLTGTYDLDHQTGAGFSRLVQYNYDAANRLTNVSDVHQNATISFDPVTGAKIREKYDTGGVANGSTSYAYDAFGRIANETTASAAGASLRQTQFQWDAVDNLASKTVSGAGVYDGGTYQYDKASRLTGWQPQPSATGTTLPAVSYGWDASNNRTSSTDGTTTTTQTYDQRDRPASIAVTGPGAPQTDVITSNARGDITNIGSRQLSYTALDELQTDGSHTYAYDALGRVASRDSTALQYDGMAPKPATVPAGAGSTETVSRRPDGQTVFSNATSSTNARAQLLDSHGNIIGGLTATGTIAGTNGFDPFGVPTSGSAILAGATPPADASSAFGYQGDWTDPTTGAVNMSARWYDPRVGTFLTRDQTDLPTREAASVNRYGYAAGNPSTHSDPSGHCTTVPLTCPGVGTSFGTVGTFDGTSDFLLWEAELAASRATTGVAAATAEFLTADAGVDVGVGVGAAAAPEIAIGALAIAGLGALFDLVFATNAPPAVHVPTAVAPPPSGLPTLTRQTINWTRAPSTTSQTVSVTNGIRTTTNTTHQIQTTNTTNTFSNGANQRGSVTSSIVTGSDTFSEPVVNPFRPGWTYQQYTRTGAVEAPNTTGAPTAGECGLGGSISSCQLPTRGPTACTGVNATARLCVAAEPAAGPAGASQANAPQTQTGGSLPAGATTTRVATEPSPMTARGSGGGIDGPTIPSSSDECEPDDGYRSFTSAKRGLGQTENGWVYDHIVEQTQMKPHRSGFPSDMVNNPCNMVAVPAWVNNARAAWYASKRRGTGNLIVRDWLNGQSFEFQRQYGFTVLAQILKGGPR
jgi:RHS repeat-associated protein